MFAVLQSLIREQPVASAAAAIAVIGALTIAGFFYFQYVLGLPPCPLCLQQRDPYYVAVPLAALLWLGAGYGASRKVMVAGFVVIAAAALWGAGLGGYHAGIEWKLWAGPSDCSGPLGALGGGGSVLEQLRDFSPVRCDVVAWRFLGLSLAGWNVLVSLALVAIAAYGARAALARSSD